MRIVELRNISFAYKSFSIKKKRKQVLSDISLVINAGKNLGILGGNGVGKSTLLKIIAGILMPDSGEVIFEKKIRSVFIGLQPGFLLHLSGFENIKLVCVLLGMSNLDIKNKLDMIAQYSELGSLLKEPVYTYSAGMRARLAFSIAIYSDPDLLLIDEAMGVGDRVFKAKSSISLNSLIIGNSAAVIVSHDESYLESVCQEILFFDGGKMACRKVGLNQ